MPSVQQGARGTIDLLDDLVVQEMMAKVAQLEPSPDPLMTLFMSLEKALPTRNAEPQHSEDELLPNIDLVAGAHTAADLTIAVDNPLFYLVGDILHVPRTGENMRVTVAPGTSPVTVVRGGSVGSAPAAMLDDEPIWILGGAQREGDTSRNALNTLEIARTFYCQIIRNSIDAVGSQMHTEQYGGSFEDQVEKKLIEHKRSIERFFKFGTASRTTDSGQWLRTMQGLIDRFQTNRFAVNGVLGEGEWDAFLEMGGQFGHDRKLFLCAPRVGRAINNFAKGRLVTVPLDEAYGLTMRRYEGPSLIVDIVYDRELKGATYGGWGILLDPDYAVIRYLRGGEEKTADYRGNLFCKQIENIQPNDSDTRKDEFFSELTLQYIHERTGAVLIDVDG